MKNSYNNIQVKENTKAKNFKNKKVASKDAEAKARRKIAENWRTLAKNQKYKEATIKEQCFRETLLMKDELFDGILLNLDDHNCSKSMSLQKRVLRRIVEKRQAQQAHRIIGRSQNRYVGYITNKCASRSMKALQRFQMCA